MRWCCCISWCTRSAPPPPPSSRSWTSSCQAPPRSRRPPNGCRGRRGPIYCHSCEVSGACHFFRSGLTRVLYNGFPNYNIDFIKFWWNTLQQNKITVQGVGWVSEFALKWSQMNRMYCNLISYQGKCNSFSQVPNSLSVVGQLLLSLRILAIVAHRPEAACLH